MTHRRPRLLPVALVTALAVAATTALAGCGSGDAPEAAAAVRPSTPVGPGGSATTGRFFAADSPWNERVDSKPVDPASDAMLRLAAERESAVQQPGDDAPTIVRTPVHAGVTVNTVRWTGPIVEGGPTTRLVCRQQRCGAAVEALPVPAKIDPDPRFDGWFTIVDGRRAYDLWRARRESDGSISYQFMRVWDLDGSGAGAAGQASARGSGLPLFAGVIRTSELEAGTIDHAIAISVPGPAQRRYVAPASTTNGTGELSALPEGARLRLKAGVRITSTTVRGRPVSRQQQRARDAILVALRKYGAIVVDRSSVPTLYAERGISADALAGDELRGIGLRSFDVVKLGPVLGNDPAPTTPETTP